MHADDVGDERGQQDEQDDHNNHAGSRSIFETSRAAAVGNEDRSNDEHQKEDSANGAEQDVNGDDARPGVDESNGQSQQNPAYDVVSDACRKLDSGMSR
jgi:hypothetical protein